MITISITEDDYFLPEDGGAAKARFLELLHAPGETWIAAYGFTLQPMFDEIKAADAAGVPIHLLIDHSQATGHAEAPEVKALAASLKHGDLTLTSAGVGSGKPASIWHWKGLVTMAANALDAWCLDGSTNFSAGAWDQGNSMRAFLSREWGARFIQQFEAHKAWAIANEPQWQMKAVP